MMRNLYATAAKGLALAASTVTPLLVLFDPSSRASRAAMDGSVVDAMNVGILLMALVGWADVVWHDLRGRMIWPTLNPHIRHHICVLLYAGLASAYGMRLFSWADPLSQSNILLAGYYALQAVFIGFVAVAIALEQRDGESV